MKPQMNTYMHFGGEVKRLLVLVHVVGGAGTKEVEGYSCTQKLWQTEMKAGQALKG